MPKKYVFAVITSYDGSRPLYDAFCQEEVAGEGLVEIPIHNRGPFNKIQTVKMEAFKIGEILVLHDDEYGREVSGMQRKPCKWFLKYECFESVDDAIARAEEVMKQQELKQDA